MFVMEFKECYSNTQELKFSFLPSHEMQINLSAKFVLSFKTKPVQEKKKH